MVNQQSEPGFPRRNFDCVSRRHFLRTTAAAAFLSPIPDLALSAAERPSRPLESLIDVNVNLSCWPLRRLKCDETMALVSMLRSQRVSQAWAGNFDALLHKDLAASNAWLAEQCHRHGRDLLVPFGSVNPRAPDWEEDLRRCAIEHRMPGIRLWPNYHGYTLEDPQLARLLRLATDQGLIIQIALLMEDERMMHPQWRVQPVETAPLSGLIRQSPPARIVLLNALGKLNGTALREVVGAGDVFVEISMLEGVGGLSNLLSQVPARRVLFGSHAPLFYFQSALLKLKESPLTAEQSRAIRSINAKTLLRSH